MNIPAATAERVQAQAKPLGVPLVHGQFFPIRLLPDPVVGDRLNIGVAFIDEGGVVQCRIAHDYARLKCLYGNRVDVDSFEQLGELIESDLAGTMLVEGADSLSENIEFGQRLPSAGFGVDEILERHFRALVPFASSQHDLSAVTPARRTDSLRKRVTDDLRSRYGSATEPLLHGGPIKLSAEFGSARTLSLPLHDRTTGQAGDIVSAATANASTSSHALNSSMVNLLTLRCAERDRPLGLFVLEPDETISKGRDIQGVLDSIEHATAVAKGSKVTVERRRNERALADTIANWRKVA